MQRSQNQLFGKRGYLFTLILLLFAAVVCVAFSTDEDKDFDTSKREIVLRRIGHELLLQSGDSTSRVLPVEKISENEYQIRFENELTFQPASLVNITQRLLSKDPLATDYIVNVLNCGNSSVAYGFAISKNRKDDIVTCLGRKQPKACYIINIKFKTKGIQTANYGYLLGSLSVLLLLGWILFKYVKKSKKIPKSPQDDTFTLGSIVFDSKNKKLIKNEEIIDLTATETRILLIFALSPNKTIERSRLQKEIWEDDGVIVGRSLDMFISKLRKKLEIDPNIKIVVIRAKGYKLEISA